jgi:zinc protease
MRGAMVLAAVWAGLTVTSPAKDKGLANPVIVKSLPNGLQVAMVPHDSPGIVAYSTLVRVGSGHDAEPGHSAFAHLFEHLMSRGTRRFPAETRENLLRARGAYQNSFTSCDLTLFTIVSPTDALPVVVEMEADRVQNLLHSRPAYETESRAILGEYRKSLSHPEERMEEALLALAFRKHPYRYPTLGLLEDIRSLPERFEHSHKFFRSFYRPDNAVIFVVGDFDLHKTFELVQKHYGSWSGKAERPALPKESAQTRERRKALTWDAPTKPRLMVGYRAPSLGTDLAAAAAQHVLGAYLFGEGSPLFQELVLERGLVESLGPRYLDARDPRLFSCLVRLRSAEALPLVEKAIHNSVRDLRNGKVDQARVEAAKSNLRYGLLMYLETPARIAEVLALLASATGDPQTANRLFERIAQVTPAELVAFARKYLVKGNRTVVTLVGGPAASEKTGPAPAKGGR